MENLRHACDRAKSSEGAHPKIAAAAAGAGAVGSSISAASSPNSVPPRRHSLPEFPIAVPLHSVPGGANPASLANPRAPQPRASSTCYPQLMAAAAGIEQLVDERFYAALNTYVEYRKI